MGMMIHPRGISKLYSGDLSKSVIPITSLQLRHEMSRHRGPNADRKLGLRDCSPTNSTATRAKVRLRAHAVLRQVHSQIAFPDIVLPNLSRQGQTPAQART